MPAKKKKLSKVEFNPHIGPLESCVKNFTKLVHNIVHKYEKKAASIGIEYADMVNDGFIGLIKAYSRFDPVAFKNESGEPLQFMTYAFPMVEGEIQRLLRDYNPGAKFSRTDKDVSGKISYNNAKDPGFMDKPAEEIAKYLGVDVKRVSGALDYMHHRSAVSINKIVSEGDGEAITLQDQLGTNEDYTLANVNVFLGNLPKKYRNIIKLRMQEKTQFEIGQIMGFSQVQISRLMDKIEEITSCWLSGKPIEWLLEYEDGEEPEKFVQPPKPPGIKGRKPGGDTAKVVRFLKDGIYTQRKICELTGCSSRTVTNITKELQEKGELSLEYSKKRRRKEGGVQSCQLGDVVNVVATKSHHMEQQNYVKSVKASA